MNSKRGLGWVVAAVVVMSVVGCGSGDNGVTPLTGVNITRATEGTFSESARVLAARDAAGAGATWLSADVARSADGDLSVIRAAFPQVKNVAARPEHDLRTVVVAVDGRAAWVSSWRGGNVATGESALDALLTEFVPESVVSLGTPIEGGTEYFTLRFAQSLNMVRLAERLNTASANIVAADPNYMAGDGDNIKRGDAGTRRYVFSRGWGDCPAGCINRHSWEFAVSGDGKTATLIAETGDALDAYSAQSGGAR